MERKKTILLVEDEFLIALSEKVILERYGFAVVQTGTGEEAVHIALSNETIDLVLMDIDLGPGIDGTEAAQRILARRNVPIVFLSSHTERDVVERTEDITSYGYIVKNSGETVLIVSIRMAFKLFESEQIAKGNEERYRALFTNLHDAVFVADADSGMILDANPVAQKLVGRPACELRQMHQTQLHPPGLHGEMIDPFRMHADRHPDGLLREVPVRHADGTETICEVGTTGSYEIQNLRYHVGVFRDVTERKRVEAAVVHNEKLYRTLMENSIDGVKLINREGRILNVNQAACDMIGYTREELLSKSIPDIDPDFSRERFIRFWDDKDGQRSEYVRTTHRHKSGRPIPVEVLVIRFDLDGEPLLFGISRDLSLR